MRQEARPFFIRVIREIRGRFPLFAQTVSCTLGFATRSLPHDGCHHSWEHSAVLKQPFLSPPRNLTRRRRFFVISPDRPPEPSAGPLAFAPVCRKISVRFFPEVRDRLMSGSAESRTSPTLL